MENRSVLSALHRALAHVEVGRYPTLVCTGGHLSLATVRLLDELSGRGAVARYSGDFDAAGLMIAHALASRIGAAFEPWRMSPEAFERALTARKADRRVDGGVPTPATAARFPDLARLVEERGAAYQEGLLEVLVEDVMEWVEG